MAMGVDMRELLTVRGPDMIAEAHELHGPTITGLASGVGGGRTATEALAQNIGSGKGQSQDNGIC